MLPAGEEPNHHDSSTFSAAHEIVELVVLTADEAFLVTLREAIGSSTRLWHVPAADKVGDLLLAGEVGILIIDGACIAGADPGFIEQLKRQFPELVILFAGTREDESALSSLISDGSVYRFIHKPMSSARARLFVQAAIRKHEDPRNTLVLPVAARPRKTANHKLIGAVGAGLLLVLAAGMALHRAGNRNGKLPELAGAPAADPLLKRAADALAANHLADPPGDNALELYQALLARSPNDAAARAGIEEVHERLLARAENALLEERLDQAQSAIEAARRAGVNGTRVAFLEAQLNKAREREKQALARVRTQSDERASGDKLSQALRSAAQRMDQDRLIEPESDSALYYVRQAVETQPSDPGTQQAKRALGARLLLDARSALQGRDFDRTNRLMQAAAGFATQADIDATRAALLAARAQMQAEGRDRLLTLANERLQQDRLIDPANDSARYYLSSLKSLDAAFPGLAAANGELANRLLLKARRALGLGQADAAKTWLDEAATAGAPAAELGALRGELESATAARSAAATVVGAATLTRITTVQPDYPTAAARKRVEGWVDLEFTIAPDGAVRDTVIRDARPAGVFDKAAANAVRQWKFKPVLREGKAVEQRARIRVRFSLDKNA